jgi:VanZ family protein
MKNIFLRYENWCAHQPRWALWFYTALWYGFISYLSHIPTSTSASTKQMVGGNDSLNAAFRFCAHMGVFGVLGVLVYLALEQKFSFALLPFFLALCLVCCAGILDEAHQSYIPGRFARVQDVLTDTFGASLAITTLTWLRKRVNA